MAPHSFLHRHSRENSPAGSSSTHGPTATSTQRLHLLTLPREVRNEIYTYLIRPVDYIWFHIFRGIENRDPDDPDVRDMSSVPFFSGPTPSAMTLAMIEIDNMPLINVLLTCSRLRDEYAESACFKGLSMTVLLPLDLGICHGAPLLSRGLRSDHKDSDVTRIMQSLVPHVRHLTIFVTNNDPGRDSAWNTIHSFFSALFPFLATPNQFSTIKVGVHVEYCGEQPLSIQDNLRRRGLHTNQFLTAPPLSLQGLRLKQRAAGYKLRPRTTNDDFATEGGVDRMGYLQSHPFPPAQSTSGPLGGTSSLLIKDGVYLFAKDGMDVESRMWTKEQVEGADEKMPCHVIGRSAPHFLEWREKRGSGLRDWEADDCE